MGTVGTFFCFFAAIYFAKLLILLAPEVGLEPTTLRLTLGISYFQCCSLLLYLAHTKLLIAFMRNLWTVGITRYSSSF